MDQASDFAVIYITCCLISYFRFEFWFSCPRWKEILSETYTVLVSRIILQENAPFSYYRTITLSIASFIFLCLYDYERSQIKHVIVRVPQEER